MKIWELFSGYEKAHGRYDVRRTSDRGKAEGRATTIGAPATEALWQVHLDGSGPGVGIIPLRTDNTVLWAAIDIDVFNLDHVKLEQQIKRLSLPLVVCRSKSGGAHCFVFFKEPAPAPAVVQALESYAALLGYGGCEIFPKQTSRYDEDKDVGNWLNMPYFHIAQTNRPCIHDGKELTLDEFLAYAEASRVTAADLTEAQIDESLFEDGPPCLQVLHAKGGFPDGTRNGGMYNVAVYLRKRFPDNWQDRVFEYNTELCNPPLTLSEINTLVKSVGRKQYQYRCKQPPINSHCSRRQCLQRKFGVGESIETASLPEMGQLTKHEGDPVLWYTEVAGRRIQMTTEDLMNQRLFKKKIADSINRVIKTVPQSRWEQFIDEKMQQCDVVQVPEDATPMGQFRIMVETYATGLAQATSLDELANRFTPYRNGNGEILIRSTGLFNYMNTHNFYFKSEAHVWQMMREMGAIKQFIKAGGKGFNVWVLKEPQEKFEDAPPPKFGSEEF